MYTSDVDIDSCDDDTTGSDADVVLSGMSQLSESWRRLDWRIVWVQGKHLQDPGRNLAIYLSQEKKETIQ